jgi:hypothetical protein
VVKKLEIQIDRFGRMILNPIAQEKGARYALGTRIEKKFKHLAKLNDHETLTQDTKTKIQKLIAGKF